MKNPWLFLLLIMAILISGQSGRKNIHHSYINMVVKGIGIQGVELYPGSAVQYQEQLRHVHPAWIKTYLKWKDVESIHGTYTWDPVFDADYPIILSSGAEILLVLKMAPAWARTDSRACGRVSPEFISDFANFARQVALRYPHIRYYEIWNEQDSQFGSDTPPYDYYGCWGDPNESYFGGAYYATVINPVRFAIQSVRPNAKVYFGGLMLPVGTLQAEYFEGAVKAGAKFDGVSFHHYAWYSTGNTSPEVAVSLLRQVMTKYNYTRPIMLSETSMLYWSPGEPYETTQANYLRYIHGETIRLGLQNFIWYTLNDNGWYHSGLMEGTRLKPVYYQFINEE